MSDLKVHYHIPYSFETFSYEAALASLHDALRFGITPLLETVDEMLDVAGRPDEYFDAVQIAGTNGKTSTSRYAAAILTHEGYTTALYTSPELVDYNERMEIDGCVVSRDVFSRGIAAAVEAGNRVRKAHDVYGETIEITEFDTLTVAAFIIFAEAQVDCAVLEVGMGGRWDATSTARRIRSVAICGIGLDHTRILGDTLEKIAAEKAAVIKPGRTCALGSGALEQPSVAEVFFDRLREVSTTPVCVRPCGGSVLSYPTASYEVTHSPLAFNDALEIEVHTPQNSYLQLRAYKPRYQAQNIALAVVLCEQFLERPLTNNSLRDAILKCPTPGRFDLIRSRPLLLIDAAHNPQSVGVFVDEIVSRLPDRKTRPALLCAVLSDKDAGGITRILASEFDSVYVTQTSSPRAMPSADLAKLFEREGNTPVFVFCDVSSALKALNTTPLVALGSITLAGEILRQQRDSLLQ